ncbi:MAG: hypothetical protein F6K24_52470 [Okeania sp. SIO2D1]|uniref:hypothetical protein n=1 Tax=Okeania sp. SIO2C9 TaxID=2607791 RepID=UPI0013BA1991|nr:hypothetical protein [Okeania sp. SIO2C9]NEQ72847.1 hypothetical protein [Okeania sp. SIO2C9]NES73205.1 hypothetical protein [Okeania sp. SIO2D1]
MATVVYLFENRYKCNFIEKWYNLATLEGILKKGIKFIDLKYQKLSKHSAIAFLSFKGNTANS